MQKSGPNLLIPIIYEKIFSPNELVRKYSLRQLAAQLDNLFEFDDLLINYEQMDDSFIIKRLKQLPDSNNLLESNDKKKSILALSQRFTNYYTCIVRSLSILNAILKYGNNSTKPVEDQFMQINDAKKEFENKTNISISEINDLIEIDLNDSMPEFIDLYYQKKKEIIQEKTDVINKMRDQHHMCLVCRTRPALYFAMPCAHPCFCMKCLQDLADKKFIYNRCLNCQSVVESVERLSFLKQ